MQPCGRGKGTRLSWERNSLRQQLSNYLTRMIKLAQFRPMKPSNNIIHYSGFETMQQNKKCAYDEVELSSDDILFILSCIESSEKQNLKELGEKALYVRLVQTYVNLVGDCIEPASMRKQPTLEVVN
jgi:hypothetical protein